MSWQTERKRQEILQEIDALTDPGGQDIRPLSIHESRRLKALNEALENLPSDTGQPPQYGEVHQLTLGGSTTRHDYFEGLTAAKRGRFDYPSSVKDSPLSKKTGKEEKNNPPYPDPNNTIGSLMNFFDELGPDGRDFLSKHVLSEGISPENLTRPQLTGLIDAYKKTYGTPPEEPRRVHTGRKIFGIPVGKHVDETIFEDRGPTDPQSGISEQRTTAWQRLRQSRAERSAPNKKR